MSYLDTHGLTTLWNKIKTYINNYHDSTKQATLVSGTNIKTVNNNSLLGSGNITIASSWNDISGKPSEFPPEDHNHSFLEVLNNATVSETGEDSPKQSKLNYYINSSSPGNEIQYSAWNIRYFDVQGLDKVFVTWTNGSNYNAWYSADGTYISNTGNIAVGTTTLMVPANAAILGLSNRSADMNAAVVTGGAGATLADVLDNKVNKVTGKGLSTNDFTNAYKGTVDFCVNHINIDGVTQTVVNHEVDLDLSAYTKKADVGVITDARIEEICELPGESGFTLTVSSSSYGTWTITYANGGTETKSGANFAGTYSNVVSFGTSPFAAAAYDKAYTYDITNLAGVTETVTESQHVFIQTATITLQSDMIITNTWDDD